MSEKARWQGSGLVLAVMAGVCGFSSGSGTLHGQGPDYALLFDSVPYQSDSDFVNLGAPSTLKPISELTIEAWVYPERANSGAWGAAGFILSDGRDCCDSPSQGGVGVHLVGTPDEQRVRAYIWDAAGQHAVAGLSPMAPEMWHHVAFVFDGASLTVYQDGVQEGQNVLLGSTTILPNGKSVLVGVLNFQVPTFYPFLGKIDELRVWNVARTQSQIASMMSQSLTGLEPGLVGYYQMNEGGGQSIVDLTPNGNYGQLGSTAGPDVHDPSWADGFGVALDEDGDGVPDDLDLCPASDLSATVVIDSCDSGVPNLEVFPGCTISDQVSVLGGTAGNHSDFVSGAAHLTIELKQAGLINAKQKSSIGRCAARSSSP